MCQEYDVTPADDVDASSGLDDTSAAMSGDRNEPDRKTAARNEAARRKARQAEALRANLRRRKEQARGRAEDAEAPDETRREAQK